MPSQMRKGFNGTPRAGKAGTAVKRVRMSAPFRAQSGTGIAAHGMPKFVNAPETVDRRQ